MYINKVVFSDGSEKEFSDSGTRAMKETTAYMMTEMLKTVLTSGSGYNAYIPWIPQAGKTGTSNYTDDEIENHIKTRQLVAPDELFTGYTRKYSMAVWTGYTNRLTPVVGNGLTVAARVYRSMMTYLTENNHPGDWSIPDGLYRNGGFIFKNGARNTWTAPVIQETPVVENSTSSTEESTSTTTETNGQQNNSTNSNSNQRTTIQGEQPPFVQQR